MPPESRRGHATGILTRTGPRSVGSVLGFEVHESFPYALEYREGDRVFRMSAEMASAASGASILLWEDMDADRWQPPHEAEPFDDAKKHQILVRVSAALVLLGIKPAWECLSRLGPRRDWPVIEAEAAALLRRSDA